MRLSKGESEVLALDVFLKIILNLYVCHITHLIVDNLISLKKNSLLPFLLISMSHHRVRKRVGFSALVQQEMFKGVDIGN